MSFQCCAQNVRQVQLEDKLVLENPRLLPLFPIKMHLKDKFVIVWLGQRQNDRYRRCRSAP